MQRHQIPAYFLPPRTVNGLVQAVHLGQHLPLANHLKYHPAHPRVGVVAPDLAQLAVGDGVEVGELGGHGEAILYGRTATYNTT